MYGTFLLAGKLYQFSREKAKISLVQQASFFLTLLHLVWCLQAKAVLLAVGGEFVNSGFRLWQRSGPTVVSV